MIHIHDSPTPSRRSTDYADIGPGRFPQTGFGYPNPEVMMNGHVGHHTAGNAQQMYPHNQHTSHDSHMPMHHGQFNPNEQGYPHGNAPNRHHQFTHRGQDYPDGGMAQQHHMQRQFEQNYPQGSQANSRDQFSPNQQEYPLQNMHRDPNEQEYPLQNMHRDPNEQEYPLQNMNRDQFSPNEQEYPLQNMHDMGGMSYQLQDNTSSGQMSNRFVDTLTRVHTPPNPHNKYPHTGGNLDYPPSSSRNSQSTEESWNPAENLNYRGHMTNNPVSRSSSFKSTVSTTSFEKGPLPPNISPMVNDSRARAPLSPLPENQFFEHGHNGNSMQDLQHIHPSEHVSNRSRSVGQRMNRMGNQDLRSRAQSFEGMIDMESNQQRATRMELSESNLDIQQRALPPPPTSGVEPRHAVSLNPVPNPHSIEYTMNPNVQMSHSQSIPPVQARKPTQYPGQNTQQPLRSYQQRENQVRSHGYPSQQIHTANHPSHRQQSTSVANTTHQKMSQQQQKQRSVHQQQEQMALPPPPPFIEEPTRPTGGQRFRDHHSKNQKQQHPLSQRHPGVAQSMIQLQHQDMGGHYKPEMSQHQDHHQRQQSLPDDQGIPAHQQQHNFNHIPNSKIMPQHVPSVNQSTPNLAFNVTVSQRQMNGSSTSGATPAGFRRVPMTGGHTESQYDDQISQDTVTAWEQVDQIQQQFELDMQNMLTPRVTDEMETDRRGQFHFENDTLNLNDSINSISSFQSHTNSMVSPIANMKAPNGLMITSSSSSSSSLAPPPVRAKPPKVAPKMNPKSSFDGSSSQSHKRRLSIPDNDPKKPQLKKGKYPKAVWVQKSMNQTIESSSDSESDSDRSMDTIIAGPAADNESLKSSHV